MDTAGTRRGGLPRLLSRALWILGGTVAATATAWLITSASASADTLPTLPVVSDPVASVSDTLAAVGLPAVHPAALPLPAGPGRTAARVRGVTSELDSAVSQLSGHLRVGKSMAAAPLTVLPSTPTAMSTPAGQSGPAAGRTPDRTPPPAAATIATPVPAGHSMARRSGARPTRSGTPHTLSPVPSTPRSPAPWNPVSVPTAPVGGGAGTPGPGAPGLLDTSGDFPVPGMGQARVVPVTAPLGAVTPGRQPGITPD